jgi:hypothetical protein
MMKKTVSSWIIFFITCLLCSASSAFSGESKRSTPYETGMYYTIQKGDTLWDLSQTFFDSPWYWPDLWEENSQIANPHWIYPGERIRLFRKDGMTDYSTSTPSSGVPSGPKETSMVAIQEPPQKKPSHFYPKIDQVGFIRKQPIRPSGKLFNVEGNKTLIGEGDLVYITDFSAKELTLGMQYFTYKLQLPLKNKALSAKYGYQHYLTGVIEITELKDAYAIARVVDSFRTISVGNLLIPFQKRSPNIAYIPIDKNLEGRIIISEEHEMIIGDDTIAFIDKGEEDGVRIGQNYTIFRQRKGFQRPKEGGSSLPPYNYGELLVLHTEANTSTVLITRATEDILPGARFYTLKSP